MKVQPTRLPEVLLLEPDVHVDARGWLTETWHEERHAALGVPRAFAQDLLAQSAPGVLRGLHLQHPTGQGKLVTVLAGGVLDVAVDLRVGSPRFGKHASVHLVAEEHRQLWIPPGFAHGYCVVGERVALVSYKCSAPYHPEHELAVRWDDRSLAIDWPVPRPLVSDRDAAAPLLDQIPKEKLPRYVLPEASAP